MHAHTESLLHHLRAQHACLRAALETIPKEKRRLRPAPDRWSAAEILEHLGIVETRFLKMLQSAPLEGSGPASSPAVLLDLDLLLDRTTRITAQETALPPGKLDDTEALQQLEQLRAKLEHELSARDGVDLSTVTRDHARLGPLNLYQWIYFAGAHEGRHALQVREVGETLGKNDQSPASP